MIYIEPLLELSNLATALVSTGAFYMEMESAFAL